MDFNMPKLLVLMVLAMVANLGADGGSNTWLTITMTCIMMLLGATETRP